MTMELSTVSIWKELNDDLLSFIRRRVPDDNIADDLLQETLLRVHRNLDDLEYADRLAAWVFQIARNVIRDHYRKSAAAPESLTDEACESNSEATKYCMPECDIRWMHELVGQLPDGYREAIRLAEFDGLSQQEVADKLNLSLSGAKSRIQRGRVMLREILEQCCRFEVDRRGNVMNYEPRPERSVCRDCDK